MNTADVPALLKAWRERGSPLLEQVQSIAGEGPYSTKAKATLWKLLELTPEVCAEDFLQWQHPANAASEPNIRGFRLYTVLEQAADSIGGTEFHRQRQEMVYGVAGEFEWVCEDLRGNRSTHTIKPGTGVWMPPFILHTFTARVSGSGLLVACNTRYNASDPSTFDTFSAEVFASLQQQLRAET